MTTVANGEPVTLEQVLTLAHKLRPTDQARLIVRLTPKIAAFLDEVEAETAVPARRPLRGLFADLGAAPSAGEIDEVQREMWANFDQEEQA